MNSTQFDHERSLKATLETISSLKSFLLNRFVLTAITLLISTVLTLLLAWMSTPDQVTTLDPCANGSLAACATIAIEQTAEQYYQIKDGIEEETMTYDFGAQSNTGLADTGGLLQKAMQNAAAEKKHSIQQVQANTGLDPNEIAEGATINRSEIINTAAAGKLVTISWEDPRTGEIKTQTLSQGEAQSVGILLFQILQNSDKSIQKNHSPYEIAAQAIDYAESVEAAKIEMLREQGRGALAAKLNAKDPYGNIKPGQENLFNAEVAKSSDRQVFVDALGGVYRGE